MIMNEHIEKISFIRFCSFKLLISSISILLLSNALTVRAEEVLSEQAVLSQVQKSYIRGDYDEAILLLEDLLQRPHKANINSVDAHSDLAEIYRHLGQYNKAIANWKKAIELVPTQNSRLSETRPTKLGQLKLDLARAYIHLGQGSLAIPLLQSVLDLAKVAEPEIKNAAQISLGNAYKISGKYDKAITAYTDSLKQTQSLETNITILNGLVDVHQFRSQQYLADARGAKLERSSNLSAEYTQLARENRVKAREYAERAARESKNSISVAAARALINSSLMSAGEITPSELDKILSVTKALPGSRSKAYLLINLAELQPRRAVEILNQAVVTATRLEDKRALSFAAGALANIYETRDALKLALFWTQKAELAAQEVFAIDSLYQWQWQAGRIHRAMGSDDAAKSAYTEAIASVQSIRNDLLDAENNLQLDFRSQVEPIYRQYLSLLLDSGDRAEIEKALATADLLQISQLQSFFGDDCIEIQSNFQSNSNTAFANKYGTDTAIVRSIILEDKTYLILKLPDGTVKSYPVAIEAKQLQAQIENWRYLLTDLSTNRYLNPSKSLYDLLFRPLAKDLADTNIEKIVFINDGRLRNVPMSALHDGQKFLIEQYDLSYSLGLNFTARDNRKLDKLEALAFGLTVEKNGFPALANIRREINGIAKFIDVNQFINTEFVRQNFRKQLESAYPIVHIATHAQFGGSSESAFIQAFDREISLIELESMLSKLQQPIELLVLSACETAAGNDRSVLGLAGIALRNNVSNVVGSLWAVDDAQTANLMESFYKNLSQDSLSESEALREAQLGQIEQIFGHPATWSSFMVIR